MEFLAKVIELINRDLGFWRSDELTESIERLTKEDQVDALRYRIDVLDHYMHLLEWVRSDMNRLDLSYTPPLNLDQQGMVYNLGYREGIEGVERDLTESEPGWVSMYESGYRRGQEERDSDEALQRGG